MVDVTAFIDSNEPWLSGISMYKDTNGYGHCSVRSQLGPDELALAVVVH